MSNNWALSLQDRIRARELYIIQGYSLRIVAQCFDIDEDQLRNELGRSGMRERRLRKTKGVAGIPPGYEHMFPDKCKEGLLTFMRESDFDYGIPV